MHLMAAALATNDAVKAFVPTDSFEGPVYEDTLPMPSIGTAAAIRPIKGGGCCQGSNAKGHGALVYSWVDRLRPSRRGTKTAHDSIRPALIRCDSMRFVQPPHALLLHVRPCFHAVVAIVSPRIFPSCFDSPHFYTNAPPCPQCYLCFVTHSPILSDPTMAPPHLVFGISTARHVKATHTGTRLRNK